MCFYVVQNHGGVILNISATLYYKGTALQAHAGTAKAAIGSLNIPIFVFATQSRFALWCPFALLETSNNPTTRFNYVHSFVSQLYTMTDGLSKDS